MNSKQAASWPDATVLLTKSGRRANNLTLKKEKKKKVLVLQQVDSVGKL